MAARIDYTKPVLHDMETSEFIRNATAEEIADCERDAEETGICGEVIVDGRVCYVDGPYTAAQLG